MCPTVAAVAVQGPRNPDGYTFGGGVIEGRRTPMYIGGGILGLILLILLILWLTGNL
jgi:hypothetical protein